MDIFDPMVCVGAALSVLMLVYMIRLEKTRVMRTGLAVVYAFTGVAFWAVSKEFIAQAFSVSMAATGVGCVVYFAIRGAQPPR